MFFLGFVIYHKAIILMSDLHEKFAKGKQPESSILLGAILIISEKQISTVVSQESFLIEDVV